MKQAKQEVHLLKHFLVALCLVEFWWQRKWLLEEASRSSLSSNSDLLLAKAEPVGTSAITSLVGENLLGELICFAEEEDLADTSTLAARWVRKEGGRHTRAALHLPPVAEPFLPWAESYMQALEDPMLEHDPKQAVAGGSP